MFAATVFGISDNPPVHERSRKWETNVLPKGWLRATKRTPQPHRSDKLPTRAGLYNSQLLDFS
jgi:hypothetical protein